MRLFAPVLASVSPAVGSSAVSSTQSQSDAAGVIAGVVVDHAGSVIPGATVELRSGQRVDRQGRRPTRDGGFRFANVAGRHLRDRRRRWPASDADRRRSTVGHRPQPLPPLRLAMIGRRAPRGERWQTVAVQRQRRRRLPAPLRRRRRRSARVGGPRRRAAGGHQLRVVARRPPFNTEAYDQIDENSFRRVD